MAARSSNRQYAPRSLGGAGPVALGLFLIFLFMYLRFPYDRLAEIIEVRIEQSTGLRLELADLGPSLQLLGPGIGATDVRATRPDGSVLIFERVKLRPAWSLSWLMGDPALFMLIGSVIGEARGALTLGTAPRWSGDFFDFDVSQLPTADVAPGTSVTGRADAMVDIALDESGPMGSVRLVAREGSLEHPELPLTLPFDELGGELRLGGEHRVEILSLNLESPLVTGSLTGTIGRSPTLETAPLRLEGSFTVRKEIRGALNAQGVKLESSGSSEFVVMGTLARPIVR